MFEIFVLLHKIDSVFCAPLFSLHFTSYLELVVDSRLTDTFDFLSLRSTSLSLPEEMVLTGLELNSIRCCSSSPGGFLGGLNIFDIEEEIVYGTDEIFDGFGDAVVIEVYSSDNIVLILRELLSVVTIDEDNKCFEQSDESLAVNN